MNQMVQENNQAGVGPLVGRHLEQLQQESRRWQQEAARLMALQRAEHRSYVLR
jgi:hypothetical protein